MPFSKSRNSKASEDNASTKKPKDPYLIAKRYCLALCGAASSKKLSQHLQKEGFSTQEIHLAVEQCREHQYFDEGALACSIGRLAARRGKDRRQLMQQLWRRGIERQYWDQAIEEFLIINEEEGLARSSDQEELDNDTFDPS
jgi:SOS response regulatory protein OraA/RecX